MKPIKLQCEQYNEKKNYFKQQIDHLRDKTDMNNTKIVPSNTKLKLSKCLNKWHSLYIPNCSTKLEKKRNDNCYYCKLHYANYHLSLLWSYMEFKHFMEA